MAETLDTIVAERRCGPDEAKSKIESELAAGERTAYGHRVAAGKYRSVPQKAPDGRILRYDDIVVEPAGIPAQGQAKEEIPRAWWIKAAGASYISDVIPYYAENRVWSDWGFEYINVEISTPNTLYGAKQRNAKEYIVEHDADLKLLNNKTEAARRVAAAVSCSFELARKAIREEWGSLPQTK